MDRPEDRVALIEVLDSDGRVLRAVDVQRWPFTIGRALDQHLVLDDPFVAAHHARLDLDASGQLTLTVGPSHNGVWLDGQPLAAGAHMAVLRPRLTLGHTQLVVRLRSQALAPEKVLPPKVTQSTAQHSKLVLLALALWLWMMASHALTLDPGADATAWLAPVVTFPAVLLTWCGAWALLSKLFRQRFEFLAHLRVALPWMLALQVIDSLVPLAAAALAWPWLWRLVPALQVLLSVALLYRHLVRVLPQHQRRVVLLLGRAKVVGSEVSLAFTYRSTDRFSSAPYMSTLPLPALNLATPQPTQDLVQNLSAVADKLAQRVAKAHQEDQAAGEDGTD
jgi:FHA domain